MTGPRALLVLTSVACALAGGCSTTPPAPPAGPRLARASDLDDAERRWGLGPPRDPAIVFQPEVVALDDGPAAIRGMHPNGAEWAIDANAKGAGEVQPGRVLFASTRAVGRVLGVRREGDTLRVVLAPVQLTDVYRELEVSLEQPVDFGEALAFASPDMPGSNAIVEPPEHDFSARAGRPAPDLVAAVRRGASLLVAPLDAQAAAPAKAPVKFRVTPLIGPNGLGIRLRSHENGLKVDAEAALFLQAPRLRVVVNITGGRLQVCELQLHGAAGLLLSFDAASSVGVSGNIKHNEPSLPTDFSIPILLNKVSPFAITVRQAFIVQTAFGGKGTLSTKGYYTFEGSFSLGYRDGGLHIGGPTSFSQKISPLTSIRGQSLGTTGLVLAHSVKVLVGVGAFGFATGPYVRLNSSLGISRDSDLVTLRNCRAARLGSSLGAGIGYVMPQPVTMAINFFLRALNLEQIKGEGGIETDPTSLIRYDTVDPNISSCGGTGAPASE